MAVLMFLSSRMIVAYNFKMFRHFTPRSMVQEILKIVHRFLPLFRAVSREQTSQRSAGRCPASAHRNPTNPLAECYVIDHSSGEIAAHSERMAMSWIWLTSLRTPTPTATTMQRQPRSPFMALPRTRPRTGDPSPHQALLRPP